MNKRNKWQDLLLMDHHLKHWILKGYLKRSCNNKAKNKSLSLRWWWRKRFGSNSARDRPHTCMRSVYVQVIHISTSSSRKVCVVHRLDVWTRWLAINDPTCSHMRKKWVLLLSAEAFMESLIPLSFTICALLPVSQGVHGIIHSTQLYLRCMDERVCNIDACHIAQWYSYNRCLFFGRPCASILRVNRSLNRSS